MKIITNNLISVCTESCLGILYYDISDRLPIFYIDTIRCITHVNPKHIIKRRFNDHHIATFAIISLFCADWYVVTLELDDPRYILGLYVLCNEFYLCRKQEDDLIYVNIGNLQN